MNQVNNTSSGTDFPKNRLSPERPIKTLAEDELGRKDFARAVAKVISQWAAHDSLVLAIYGPWGCGKSSVKNMALDALRQQKAETIFLEFNPWEWSGQDKVFEGFFEELSAALGSKDASKQAEKTARTIRKYAALLSAGASVTGLFRWTAVVLLTLLSASGLLSRFSNHTLSIAQGVVAVLALITAAVLAAFGHAADKVAAYFTAKSEANRASVSELKSKLRSMLQGLRKNVLVVIDDVDRLTPDGIRMVFQLVKANADFPNLVYLLLLQRDTVQKAIASAYNLETGDGVQFLEKVVQVGFDVPALSASKLERSIEDAVNRAVQGTPAQRRFESERWNKLFVSAFRQYFRNLRDVKRFENTLSFHLELYRTRNEFDANPVDLISLEVLRHFEPHIYERLYRQKDLLTGESRSALSFVPASERRKSAESLLAGANLIENARIVLTSLFPPFGWAAQSKDSTSGPHVGAYKAEWLRELRVCHSDVFERYFIYSLSDGQISEDQVASLSAVISDRDQVTRELKELSGKGLLGSAISRLEAEVSALAVDNPVPFITALFDVERELMIQSSAGRSARVPADVKAAFIIRSLVRQKPPVSRGEILEQAIRSTTGLYLPMITIDSPEERSSSIDPLIPADEVATALQQLCLSKVKDAEKGPDLLSHPRLRYILDLWRKWGTQGEAAAWAADQSQSDTALPFILGAFIESMNTINGGQVVQTQYRFALEQYSIYVNPDIVADRIRKLDALGDANRSTYHLFLVAFDRWKASGHSPQRQDMDDWVKLED